MPTEIQFAAENVRVKVDEDPGQVAQALASAEGLPCRLSLFGGRGDVYVNPAMVAFWSESGRGSDPDPPPQETPEPPTTRGTVTDIWGQPVRRKPRR